MTNRRNTIFLTARHYNFNEQHQILSSPSIWTIAWSQFIRSKVSRLCATFPEEKCDGESWKTPEWKFLKCLKNRCYKTRKRSRVVFRGEKNNSRGRFDFSYFNNYWEFVCFRFVIVFYKCVVYFHASLFPC